MMRSLGSLGGRLYGSPSFFPEGESSIPAHPRELLEFPWVCHTSAASPKRPITALGPENESFEFRPPQSMIVNDFACAAALTIGGVGLAALPEFLGEPAVARGELVRLFPDWVVGGGKLSVVWPEAREGSPRIQRFVALSVETFQDVGMSPR